MIFGSYTDFGIDCRPDECLPPGGRNGIIGAFTYWVRGVQFGLPGEYGLDTWRVGQNITRIEQAIESLQSPKLDYFFDMEPRRILSALRASRGLDPFVNAQHEPDDESIPDEIWDLATLAPGSNTAFDDGSCVIMSIGKTVDWTDGGDRPAIGEVDTVRIVAGRDRDIRGQIMLYDVVTRDIDLDLFRKMCQAAVQWADSCPVSWPGVH